MRDTALEISAKSRGAELAVNIKLRPGGIREWNFIAKCFQR
jgi:glutamine synthetase adenylyltransferase